MDQPTHPDATVSRTRGKKRGVMAVLKDPLLLPDFSISGGRPGFELHDNIELPDGRVASYGWLWDFVYDRVGVAAGIHNRIADLVIYQGLRPVGSDEAIARWERWIEEANFRSEVWPLLVLEAIRMGNGMGVLHRDTGRLLDLRIQVLPARGMSPSVVEETGETAWIFRWPSTRSRTDPKHGDGFLIDPESVIHLRQGNIAGTFLGRMLGYQVTDEFLELRELIKIMSAMARRSTHGLLHAKVDIEGLDEMEDVEVDDGEEELSPSEAHIQDVEDLLGKRVEVDPETGAVRIAHNLITDGTVELTDVTPKNDMPGVELASNLLLRIIDRTCRLGRVMQGEGEGSNRATALEQRRQEASFWQKLWRQLVEQMMDSILPALQISRDQLTFEVESELVLDDIEFRKMLSDLVREDFLAGLVSLEEARAEIEPHYDAELEELEPEEPIEEEEAAPPPPEPEPEPDRVG